MVLVVESITNKTGKVFRLIGRRLSSPPYRVIQHMGITYGTFHGIVQWILKKPLGILSYTLRIIQLDYPEGGP
jgi:hypothetical protein